MLGQLGLEPEAHRRAPEQVPAFAQQPPRRPRPRPRTAGPARPRGRRARRRRRAAAASRSGRASRAASPGRGTARRRAAAADRRGRAGRSPAGRAPRRTAAARSRARPGSAGSSRSGCRSCVRPVVAVICLIVRHRLPGCAGATPRAAGSASQTDVGCDMAQTAGSGDHGSSADRRPARRPHRGRDPRRSCTTSSMPRDLDGRSVCVLVPDGTRSCPLPLLVSAIHDVLHGRVSRLTVLVALGTHAAMSEQALAAHLGYRGRRPGRPLSVDDRAQPRLVGSFRFRGGRDHQCRPDRRAVRWHAAPHRSRAGQPRRGRARRHGHRQPGVPARGRRASPAATSTSSPASPAGSSSTCRTGWAR